MGWGALKTRRTAGQSTLDPENGQEQGRDQSEESEALAASVKVIIWVPPETDPEIKTSV